MDQSAEYSERYVHILEVIYHKKELFGMNPSIYVAVSLANWR
jgi:hypothetical protein